MPPGGSQKKITNSLVTLSSAAILTIYAAGFLKTRAAAALLDDASNERRPPVPMPAPATAGEVVAPAPIEPPATVSVPGPKGPGLQGQGLSPAVVIPKKTPPKPVAAPVVAAPAPTPEAPAATSVPPASPTVPESPAKEEPAPAPLLMPKDAYKDGTFLGWGSSRHGDIQASVTITNGRFVSASIAQCLTRYSCSWVAHLPPQVIARQSPEVDYVSGATQSANAFYWAITDALKKAK
jgi:uncharacterized protein with FMN-binding domain